MVEFVESEIQDGGFLVRSKVIKSLVLVVDLTWWRVCKISFPALWENWQIFSVDQRRAERIQSCEPSELLFLFVRIATTLSSCLTVSEKFFQSLPVVLAASGRGLQDGGHTLCGRNRLCQRGMVRGGAGRASGEERRRRGWYKVNAQTTNSCSALLPLKGSRVEGSGTVCSSAGKSSALSHIYCLLLIQITFCQPGSGKLQKNGLK